MPKVITQEEFERRMKTTNITPLEKYKGRRIKIKFLCYCGNEFYAHPNHIFSKGTSSCGCYRKAFPVIRAKKYGEMHAYYYNRLKSDAKRRNIRFNISIEYIWNLFLKQNRKCAYTGRVLEFSSNITKRPQNQTASLDRIDSKKGYFEGNVQWVHKGINWLKMDLSNDEFLKLCKEVYLYSVEKNNELE